MKDELASLLVGLGFSELSQRRRRLLAGLLLISAGLHVVGLLVFGGWVVLRGQREETTVFVAPPPIKTYEPRKLEHRVKVQKRQRSSSRPSLMPRLVAMKPSKLSLPAITIDPKIINTSFQPKFKAVAGTGMGVGLGTGYGIGGFGEGVSAFNFFGIRGRGDKIAILVDVSVSMVEEKRGGPSGFLRVRNRIHEVIDKMHEAAMFNVIVFADASDTWQSKMAIAKPDNKNAAKSWLRRFNSEGRYGLSHGNVQAADMGLPAVGGTTRLDLAISAAFQQGADTILIISDGEPRVEKGIDQGQRRAYEQKLQDWQQKNADEIADAQWEEKKVWVDGHDGTLREGGPRGPATKGHWEVRRVRVGMPRGMPEAPKPDYWTLEDFLEHLRRLNEAVYAKQGKKSPVVHCIGYQIDNEGGRFLKSLAHAYKGAYRRVASLR
ncbi:MAG: hypothetical protein JXR77_00725 [Lentisphaeria bacterium]|nr:hypothetical protein [Lentisphaeria bacterium]